MPSARALRFGKAVIELSLMKGDIEKQLKTLERGFRDFGTSLKSIGSSGLKLSGALAGVLAFPVKMAADMEQTRAQFKAMIGDSVKANQVLSQLQGFALVTPLGMQELSEAARQLLSFGVAVDDIVPTIKRLGEISGGDAERMGRLAYAFGQVTAAGRLMGTEVRQFIEAGFNPLQEISRTTGESMDSLRRRLEAGEISVAEVAAAMTTATSAGGRFFGLLAEMAGTTIGQFNELKESFALAVRPLGDALLPLIKDLLAEAQKLIEPLATWIKNNSKLAVTIGKATLAIGASSVALVALGAAVSSASALFTPLGAAFAGLALSATYIANGFDLVSGAVDTLEDKLRRLIDLMRIAAVFSPQLTNALKMMDAAIAAKQKIDDRAAPPPTAVTTTAVTSPASPAVQMASGPGVLSGAGSQLAASARGYALLWGAGLRLQQNAAATVAQQSIDRLDEQKRLDDEIAREKINAIDDADERERALIEYERQQMISDARGAGLLSGEVRSRIEDLTNLRLKNIDVPEQQMARMDGIFATVNASQQFGGGVPEDTKLLRKIADNTKKKPGGDQGIPVG
jgi:tape measure domain-containing protein